MLRSDGALVKSEPEMRKIRIALPEDAWHSVEAEWAWGEPIGHNIYALRNVPFYAMGLSYDDRVKADDVDGTLRLLGSCRGAVKARIESLQKRVTRIPEFSHYSRS
jgi:Domain of unknown function (DUF4265)